MTRHTGFVLLLAALTAFAPLSIDMYLPSLPTLADVFSTDTSQVQLTLSAFLIGFGIGQLIYGPLSDRYGRRPPLLIGVFLYALTSAWCALSQTIETMIILRFLQGATACAGPVIVRAIIRDRFDATEGAQMLSLVFMVMTIAPLIAPLMGGWIMLGLGWQAIFWTLAGVGMLCLLASILSLSETLPPARRQRGGFPSVIRGWGILLSHRRYLGYALSSGLIGAVLFAYLSGSPFVFIEVYGVAPEHYGWLFAINVLGVTGGAYLNRRWVGRIGVERMYALTAKVAALAGLVLLGVAWLNLGLPVLMLPLFVCVGCIGFSSANAASAALADFPQLAGSASALLGVFGFGLGALSGALVGLLHNNTALPMAFIIACCGVGSWLTHRWLIQSP